MTQPNTQRLHLLKVDVFYDLAVDIDAAYLWSAQAEREAISVRAGIYLCAEVGTKGNGEQVARLALVGNRDTWIVVATHWGPTPIGKALVETTTPKLSEAVARQRSSQAP